MSGRIRMRGRVVIAATVVWAGVSCWVGCTDEAAAPEAAVPQGDDCWPRDPSCKLAGGAGFVCLSLHDNGVGDRGTYRMSQLEIAKPAVLAGQFLQDTVTTKEITLNQPECLQEGSGRFNWLFEIDWSTGTARTGGAHIPADPRDGYCFIDGTVGGFEAAPVQLELSVGQEGGDRTFDTKVAIPSLSVPIYLDDAEATSLILPLHDVRLTEGRVSSDNDCIGRWDGDGLSLSNNCKPDKTLGQRMQWKNGAKLTAFITAEEADLVWIPQLQQTFCVALSGNITKYGEEFEDGRRCARDADGRILARDKADWCAATGAACAPPEADSFRLEGAFAANAVAIRTDCGQGR